MIGLIMESPFNPFIIELYDGKIGTGKPYDLNGKNPWVSCKFSRENQSSE
jgi:hypothetical protein